MPYTIDRVDVWVGEMADRPGALAGVLDTLAKAGAHLEFVIARRAKTGTGLVFVAPLKGAGQSKAAKGMGLAKAPSLQSLRVAGPDKPGLGAQVTCALGEAGINLRGLSAANLAKKSVVYFAFDSREDSNKARRILKKVLRIK